MNYNAFSPYYQYPQTMPQQAPLQTQQVQSGGIIRFRNDSDVENYPVAPGNSIIFLSEDNSKMCVKTMGFSQFDQPRIDKFRLERIIEQAPQVQQAEQVVSPQPTQPEYATQNEITDLKKDLEELKAMLTDSKKGAKK